MKDKASFKQLSTFAIGNVVITIISAIGSILLARWVSPEVFGEFKKYGILPSYASIGLIVIHDALWRQYPYLIGKGDTEEAIRTAASAKWWYLFISYAFSIIILAISLNSLFHGDYRAFVGWIVQICVIWNGIYNAYLVTMYRTSFDFKRLTINNLISNLVSFVFIILVKYFGFWGLCIRTVVQNILIIYLNQKYIPIKVHSKFDKKRLLNLTKMSIPISVPGYLHTSFLTATISVLVLKYFNESSLAIFITSSTLVTYCAIIASSIQQYISPQINQKYGKENSFRECIKLSIKPMVISVVSSFIIYVALFSLIGPIVGNIAPKYFSAVSVIKILSIGIILTSLELPFVSFYTALSYKSSIFLAVIKTVITIVSIICFHSTLNQIAIGVVIGQLVRVISGYILIIILSRKEINE